MSDFDKVKKALAEGADPAMLCMTCPWDRFCIAPPSMSAEDVQHYIETARQADERRSSEARSRGEKADMPVSALMATLTFAGRDSAAQICPVLASRLRSGNGRKIVDNIRAQMAGWAES